LDIIAGVDLDALGFIFLLFLFIEERTGQDYK
jgi:hypothetical protein